MTTTPTDLAPIVAFIEARIAEDEAAAKAASGDRWERLADGDPKFRKVVAWGLTPIGAMNAEQDAAHIARHSPARVLAQVAALKAIVARAQNVEDIIAGEFNVDDDGNDGTLILRHVAGIWSGHEEWDGAWA